MRLAETAVTSKEGEGPNLWALPHRWAVENVGRFMNEDRCDPESKIHVWDGDNRILGP